MNSDIDWRNDLSMKCRVCGAPADFHVCTLDQDRQSVGEELHFCEQHAKEYFESAGGTHQPDEH